MKTVFYIQDEDGRYLEYDEDMESYNWWFDKDFANKFDIVGDAHIFIIEHELDNTNVV
ncbi:hypothetical protein MUK70_11730 [Dyadobacter chenwenxiniae]|uniref:Uncharacterized protein n=1 Tax=Dyadobacter chenwenxiniae TaxID=2906456 RepID=A0A9X1PG11_9BACT|nr:hypothetical protein [Dyadobacter chenwenxiniae]MCF0059911.1 hypothetical protein [Dyadobacter chenwenxiniae]UON85650.1 hypothetical protein MUK70_11730 [Dyadobacter chenwenxiniae]